MRAKRLWASATVALVHVALLVAPVAAAGRARSLARPEAAAIVVLMLVFAVVESRALGRPDASRLGARGTRLALASGLGLLVTAWLALGWPWPETGTRSPTGLARWCWVGAPIAASGVVLRAAAMRALGDAFTSETVLAPGRAIAARGLYAHLRHPSEVGLLLVAGGTAILGASGLALVVAALWLVPASAMRIAAENALLRARER